MSTKGKRKAKEVATAQESDDEKSSAALVERFVNAGKARKERENEQGIDQRETSIPYFIAF